MEVQFNDGPITMISYRDPEWDFSHCQVVFHVKFGSVLLYKDRDPVGRDLVACCSSIDNGLSE
jgi:hypothetical protein